MPLDPAKPSRLHMAIEENRLGHYQAAIAHAEAAIELQDGGASPYLCAAYSTGRLHGDASALPWIERALALEPGNCLALSTQANLLCVLHRLQAALDSYQRWLALEPRNGAAHLCGAQIYQALQLHDQAIAAYTAAAQFVPHPAGVLTDLSILFFELGRRDDAFQILERALAADGMYAAAWYTRAEAKRFERGDRDVEVMQQMLRAHDAEPQQHAPHDKVLLHYALAKAHADLQDFPQALVHLNTGGALKRATLDYDPAVDERYMAAMQTALSATAIAHLRGAGVATDAPIFIVGMPRSGTSLLEQILASHPSVHGGGEAPHVQRLVAEFGDEYPDCMMAALPPERISGLARHYLEMLPAHSAEHITDKTPYNFLHVGLLHLMFPEARILHCVRDPLDTCISVYSKLFTHGNEFSYDIVELARYYRAYTRLMAHWRAVIPHDRLLDVEYEKLVADLEQETRRVTDFCGLPWADACLRFHETKRSVRTASMHQVREPLYGLSVGRAHSFTGLIGPLREALGAALGREA